jgi:branched-chain amino acid transport system permease protein
MTGLTETRRALAAEAKARRRIGWFVFALVLAILPLTASSFGLTVLTQICIAAVFALAYNMLLGQAGMLSFGHAIYFGLGGYLSIHLMRWVDAGLPVPLVLTPLFGGLFGLLIGLAVGSFSTRRAGTVFAMISVGIVELVASLALVLVGFFGGEEGMSADRTVGPSFFGYSLIRQIEVYYLAAAWFFLATFAMYFFSRTPAGRMANAVRDNPERVEFVGYSQRHVRLVSFAASGFFAGLAGGMFAIQYEIVTDTTLNAAASGAVLLQAYVGGVGFFVGPIVGAVLMTLLSTVVSGLTDLWLLYIGILFIATVLLAPSGLTGLVMMHQPAWRAGRMRRLAGPYLLASGPLAALVVGVIGLLEMASHRDRAAIGDDAVTLFFLQLDTASWWPWLGFSMMALAGGAGLRAVWPRLREAWDEANGPLPAAPAAGRRESGEQPKVAGATE